MWHVPKPLQRVEALLILWTIALPGSSLCSGFSNEILLEWVNVTSLKRSATTGISLHLLCLLQQAVVSC